VVVGRRMPWCFGWMGREILIRGKGGERGRSSGCYIACSPGNSRSSGVIHSRIKFIV
jgi:hypothetical protein